MSPWGPKFLDGAVDAAGNIYVSDGLNNNIQIFEQAGDYLATIGSFGPEPGQFVEADVLAIDGDGNLYVTDYENHRVQKLQLLPPLWLEATPTA